MADGAQSEIEALIALMARLPGLGPRSARRAVLHLLRKRTGLMAPLAQAMGHVAETARDCLRCGNIAGGEICAICERKSPRDQWFRGKTE